MSQTKQLGAALIGLLVALPIISYGSVLESVPLWSVGLLLILLGATVPVYQKLHRGDSCQETTKRPLWDRIFHRSSD